MFGEREDESVLATQIPELYREHDAEGEHRKKFCGECNMKAFIKANFNSILKPFAEHVDDLQQTVKKLNSSLLNVAAKQCQHSESLDDHNEKISILQTALNYTRNRTNSTHAALEVLSTEKQILTEEHTKTKVDLKHADEKLTATQFAIAELQSGLKQTRSSVGKLRESVRKMEQETASKLLPTIEQLTSDLDNLDTAHSTTVQSVHDTKLFTDNLYQAFHIFEEKNDQRNIGHDRSFQHVEDSFTKLQRTLKDMRDVAQQQSERLNNTDGAIGPMKMNLDKLEIAREEGKRRLNENDVIIAELKVASRTMGVNDAKLTEYYEEASGGEDRMTMVGSLERMLAQNTENIRQLLDITEDHTGGLRKSNNRTATLEKAVNKLQDQAGRLMERVGIFSTTELPADAEGLGNSISMCSRDRSGHSTLEVGDSTAGMGTMSLDAHATSICGICGGVQDCTVGMPAMSLDAQPRRIHENHGEEVTRSKRGMRIHETVQNHGEEVARSKCDLAQTSTHLDNADHRVSKMENQMKVTQDDMKNIQASLDLSHDYWKGLTKGFKDMNAEVNQEGKVLPVRLPGMVWDTS